MCRHERWTHYDCAEWSKFHNNHFNGRVKQSLCIKCSLVAWVKPFQNTSNSASFAYFNLRLYHQHYFCRTWNPFPDHFFVFVVLLLILLSTISSKDNSHTKWMFSISQNLAMHFSHILYDLYAKLPTRPHVNPLRYTQYHPFLWIWKLVLINLLTFWPNSPIS